mmetsp:Transcript_25553/g.39329  ORF Transcript_25553/g.39329 Transcript_25553/m.39329 type:complete len:261 (-) Transcript_25553:6-788(-)|eukprot:CAMPEP_0170492532 /NCGR_PEP_ID=MMETSP0208-20121228/12391_1 /TAXON_ID=197538 /ORGANISM="Strombidium inclinatum, Strain S3" /LENGTH=260 /DNA_ID=CAMNT_0010768285 /DNA_START=853 /DNA_END=1635 /DNA_ORIENTATION=-
MDQVALLDDMGRLCGNLSLQLRKGGGKWGSGGSLDRSLGGLLLEHLGESLDLVLKVLVLSDQPHILFLELLLISVKLLNKGGQFSHLTFQVVLVVLLAEAAPHGRLTVLLALTGSLVLDGVFAIGVGAILVVDLGGQVLHLLVSHLGRSLGFVSDISIGRVGVHQVVDLLGNGLLSAFDEVDFIRVVLGREVTSVLSVNILLILDFIDYELSLDVLLAASLLGDVLRRRHVGRVEIGQVVGLGSFGVGLVHVGGGGVGWY